MSPGRVYARRSGFATRSEEQRTTDRALKQNEFFQPFDQE